MALVRPLFVGFNSASKAAREGGDLEVTVQTARGPRVFTLPWYFVRDVDALLERWRREEHEATLLTMNNGVLGQTLWQAARAGGVRDTTFLLARGADVNYELMGFTPLRQASSRGHLAVATVLLDAGATQLDTSLYVSAGVGHTAVAALMLDRGADVHYLGDVTLLNAAWGGRLEMVRLLLDRGADIHEGNERALRDSRRNGRDAVVALLLERGAIDG